MTTHTVKWAPEALTGSLAVLEAFSKADGDGHEPEWTSELSESLWPAIDALRHVIDPPLSILVPDIENPEIRTIAMCVGLIAERPDDEAARISGYLRDRFGGTA